MVSLFCLDIVGHLGGNICRETSIRISTNLIQLFDFDVGGSLDVYWRIPEHVLGRIAVAVSPFKP